MQCPWRKTAGWARMTGYGSVAGSSPVLVYRAQWQLKCQDCFKFSFGKKKFRGKAGTMTTMVRTVQSWLKAFNFTFRITRFLGSNLLKFPLKEMLTETHANELLCRVLKWGGKKMPRDSIVQAYKSSSSRVTQENRFSLGTWEAAQATDSISCLVCTKTGSHCVAQAGRGLMILPQPRECCD